MGMMWTTENRPRYNRDKLRYPSDLTDEEWGHLEHLIPPAKRGGRRREIDEREVVNGLLYVLSTGCQWRYIPRDLPPRSTLFDYFQRWEYDERCGEFTMSSTRSAASWSIGKRVRPPASSTARALKARKKAAHTSILRAMMRARRSRGRSGILWWIPRAC